MHDPELAFVKNRSHGGTMILWRKSLDQFVKILPTETASFLGIVFHPPATQPSLHVSIYLPTSGKESEFIEEISKLRVFIEDILETYPGCPLFIRGDSNVNKNNIARLNIFQDFKSIFNLVCIPLGHNTYHHFQGGGVFDSDIDVVMHSVSDSKLASEKVERVYCQDDFAIINSHHDVIVSVLELAKNPPEITPAMTEAPNVPNTRERIIWTDESLTQYQELIGQNLSELRIRWLVPSSRTCVSIMIKLTSDILASASSSSNKSISLSSKSSSKTLRIPRAIKSSQNTLLRRCKALKKLPASDPRYAAAAIKLKNAKVNHRRVIRACNGSQNFAEDQKMYDILSNNPSSIYRKIKSLKSSSTKPIPFIKVGSEEYHGEQVKDGFLFQHYQIEDKDSHRKQQEFRGYN